MIRKKIPYNNMQTGLAVGIILPIIIMFLFYESRNMESFNDFYQLVTKAGILTHLISLCVLPNLLMFFIFMWTNRLQSARGIIAATFIYTFIVLIMKLT